MSSAAVVGAGLGGLSTAIRLAAEGWNVDVYDRQSFPGGKAGSKTISGYRFDTGPSLLTMPGVFEDLFSAAGVSMKDYLDLVPLDEVCAYHFADGTRLSSYTDIEKFAREVQAKTEVSGAVLRRFLGYSKRIYSITSELFLKRSLHEIATYLGAAFAKGLLRIAGIDPFRTMYKANRKKLRDPRMVQFFNRYATYNGSNPYAAPATLNIIPHVEYGIGASAVRGGIYSIPAALHRLALELGVRFYFETEVKSILTENGPGSRVCGIQIGDKARQYDVVISNGDVTHTYRDLLHDTKAPLYKRYQKLEPSSSGLVFFWGIKDSFAELGLHNIFFSADYRSEFSDIFDRGICPVDPTVYVNITSKVDLSDAPKGSENWFVLINAPPNRGQDWTAEATRVREVVLRTLSKRLGRSIEEVIETEEIMSPADIEKNTGSTFGSLYGISSNTKMAAFLRHPNRSRRYKGLFFVGGSVHPGGGMPLVLLSGRITADLIRKHYD